MIKVALQAKGRLNEDSMEVFKNAGIKIKNSKRKLLSQAEKFPLEVLFLRDDDIPGAVASRVADIGIVGLNEVAEKGANVEVIHQLGFGKCRISLAIPKSDEYESLDYFNGKRVATSYPNILKKFFAEKNIQAEIEEIAGSVEIAPAVNIADAIFDIVSSGGTLVSNGLKEVEKVFYSEAAIIAKPNMEPEKQEIIDQLLFRIKSSQLSKGKKYILLNIENDKIDDVLEILPSMKSPTLFPLADKNWSSLHSVVDEDSLWESIEKLKRLGATDILVLALQTIVP